MTKTWEQAAEAFLEQFGPEEGSGRLVGEVAELLASRQHAWVHNRALTESLQRIIGTLYAREIAEKMGVKRPQEIVSNHFVLRLDGDISLQVTVDAHWKGVAPNVSIDPAEYNPE